MLQFFWEMTRREKSLINADDEECVELASKSLLTGSNVLLRRKS